MATIDVANFQLIFLISVPGTRKVNVATSDGSQILSKSHLWFHIRVGVTMRMLVRAPSAGGRIDVT